MVAPQPFFSARGTPFSVLHRIRALLAAGHSVDLLTYGYGEDVPLPELPGKLRIYRSAKLPLIKSVKIGPSVPKIFLDILLFLDTRKALKRQQYDLVHSHEEAAFWIVSLCKKYNLPHLYDMHSSLPQQLSNFKAFNLGLFRNFFEYFENKVLDTCTGIITICDDLAKIVEQRVPEKPHTMIENIGDDAKIFSATDEDIVTNFDLKDKQVLLYTGTFEAYQGLDLLLESLVHIKEQLPNAVAMLVGGRPEQVTEYQQLADKLDIADSVRFSGTVHPSRIPNFIQAANVIVSPRSRGTNTPLKIYNYLRKGVPMVATDRLTHTQILNSDICHLVEASAEGFAQGVIDILNNPKQGKKIAQNAQKFAELNFSDDKYIEMVNALVDKTMQVYNTTQ